MSVSPESIEDREKAQKRLDECKDSYLCLCKQTRKKTHKEFPSSRSLLTQIAEGVHIRVRRVLALVVVLQQTLLDVAHHGQVATQIGSQVLSVDLQHVLDPREVVLHVRRLARLDAQQAHQASQE